MKKILNSKLFTQVLSLFQSLLAHYYGHNQETKKSSKSSSSIPTGRDFRQAGTKGEIANPYKHAKSDRVSITSST